MMLVTVRQVCEQHGLTYKVLKARILRGKIKPVSQKNGKKFLYDYAEILPYLYPVQDNFQDKRIATMQRNKIELEKLERQHDSDGLISKLKDKQSFHAQTEQSYAARVVASLSIYG
jgi:hypothetical protein